MFYDGTEGGARARRTSSRAKTCTHRPAAPFVLKLEVTKRILTSLASSFYSLAFRHNMLQGFQWQPRERERERERDDDEIGRIKKDPRARMGLIEREREREKEKSGWLDKADDME